MTGSRAHPSHRRGLVSSGVQAWAQFAREAFHLVVHGAVPRSVRLDDEPARAYLGCLPIPNTGKGFVVQLGLEAGLLAASATLVAGALIVGEPQPADASGGNAS